MQSISQYALAASILASVMGALVMCVLVFRYGFTVPAPADAEAGPTPTDVLITRVGHAVAGVCFAATAVLAIVALSVRAPERQAPVATALVAPTPVEVVAATEPAGEVRAASIEGDFGALELRLAEAESQLARLDSEIRSKSAREAALEPKRTVARREEVAQARLSAAAAPISIAPPAVRPAASAPAPMPLASSADPAASVPTPLPLASPAARPTASTPAAPEDPFAAFSAPAPPRVAVTDRTGDFLATAREEWHINRQRAAALVDDIRAAMTRAEQTVVRHLGNDPQGRVSPRD
jgi:hypothetical protein